MCRPVGRALVVAGVGGVAVGGGGHDDGDKTGQVCERKCHLCEGDADGNNCRGDASRKGGECGEVDRYTYIWIL